jgi:hypothetical protein
MTRHGHIFRPIKGTDVINHNLPLAKLEKIHMWLSSYLTDRTQFVEI